MAASSNVVLQFPIRSTPIAVNRKTPIRLKNVEYRSREYLTEFEVNQLIYAIGKVGRHCHRDATTIMLAYKLAQAGEDTRAIQHYLGHQNIQHTVRYTQLSSDRFKDFWKD